MAYSLRESLMRIIVSAEVRGAISGLKQFNQQVDETAANTKAASAEMNATSTSLGGVTSAANTAKSALAGIAGGLALGAAVGGVLLLTESIVDWVRELKAAIAFNKELQDILPEGGKQAAKSAESIFELQENLQLAKQGFISAKEFVAQFNATLGKTAGQVNNLSEAEASLNKNADAYIQFTLLKASANVAFGKAALAAEQAMEAGLKSAKDFENIRDKIAFNPAAGDDPAKDKAFNDAITQRQEARRKDEIDRATKQKNALLKIADDFQKQAAEIAKNSHFKNIFFDLKDEKAAKPEKPLFPVFIKPDLALIDDEHELDSQLTDFEKKLDKKISEKFGKLPVVKIPPPRLTFDQLELNKEIDKIETQLRSSLSSAFETFGETLGDLASGKGMQAFISNFGKVIGEGLKSLGKIMIEASVAILNIRKIAEKLATANPVLGIVAGVAAIAAGVLIENLTQQKIGATKFAEGGIITGPTLGLIGEKGPEVVFPLNQLSKFIRGVQGNADNRLTGNVIVRGTDLSIALSRTAKNQGLVS